MKLPFQNSKEKNINLLTEEETAGSGKKDLVLALLTPIATLVLVGFVFATLFVLEQRQRSESKNLANAIQQITSEWNQISEEANSIKSISDGLETIKTTGAKNGVFINTTETIGSHNPDGVELKTLSLGENGDIDIEGSAIDPKRIYQFVENLKEDQENFEGVNLDNIGVSEEEEVAVYNFTLSLSIKEE